MAAPVWSDTKRTDRLRVEMVCPTDITKSYGDLEGVVSASCSVDCGYYTDTRTSAKVKVIGEGWRRNSMLRLWHEVPEWDWSEPIGTYIVTDEKASRENGAWAYELTLQSLLYALSVDLLVKPWTRAKGSSALAAARSILKTCNRAYSDKGAADHKASKAVVMESGTSYLKQLFTICEETNNRLDVDARGNVTLAKRVSPSAKTPTLTIDLTDPEGVAQAGTLTRSTDYLDSSSVVAVSYKWTTQKKSGNSTKSVSHEINAWSRVTANDYRSSGTRGYTVTDFRSLTSMSPQTHARAQALADKYLKADNAELVEWTVDTCYLPVWEGDVVSLVVPDGESRYKGTRKCLVKSVSIDCEHWTMSLTLKETASGDKGDEA